MSQTPIVAQTLVPTSWPARLVTLMPLGFVAWLAMAFASHPAMAQTGISALTLAMVAGMIAANTLPRRFLIPLAPGMQVARQSMLRIGVALYGLRLTFGSIAALGLAGLFVPLLMLATTLLLGTWIGTRWFGLSRREAILVSAGSAVCGAAAAIAVSSVVGADDKKTAVAVATVVLFGTAGMLLYPYVFDVLTHHWQWRISERTFGIYIGSTLHEVAQVIAAGKQVGDGAADAAVIAKMVRVLALAPLLLVLAFLPASTLTGEAAQPTQSAPRQARNWASISKSVPWFALAFIAILAINSMHLVPDTWKPSLNAFDNWLLACAMLAIGLHTRISDLLTAGRKPLALAAALFVFLVLGGAAVCAVLL